LHQLDRQQEAAESYRTASKLNEGLLDESFDPDHLQELTSCYWGLIKIEPTTENVQKLQSSILQRCEQSGLEQVQSELDASGHSNANPLNNIGQLLANGPNPAQRRPLRAIQLARKATELEPEFHEAWQTLGIAHYRAGDFNAAVAALEKS